MDINTLSRLADVIAMSLIRPGRAAEFEQYVGAAYPKEWCVDKPCGLVAEDEDGRIVAIAMVTIDAHERRWLWFHSRKRLSAMRLHRTAIRLLRDLESAGNAAIYAFGDERQETAERWLKRLGFKPHELTMHPSGIEKMSWLRHLN